MSELWTKPFAEVERMKKADLLAYVRDLEHIAAKFKELINEPPAAFYLVWCDRNNSTPHHKHIFKEKARMEAERLARQNRGERFYVLPAFEYAISEIMPVTWNTDNTVHSDEPEEMPF